MRAARRPRREPHQRAARYAPSGPMINGPSTTTCWRVPTAPNRAVATTPSRARAGLLGAVTPRPLDCQVDHHERHRPVQPTDVFGNCATAGKVWPSRPREPTINIASSTVATPTDTRQSVVGPWPGSSVVARPGPGADPGPGAAEPVPSIPSRARLVLAPPP